MKKTLIVIACGAVLLCGCSKQNDENARINALSQKLDLVISNQAAISARLNIVPTAKGMLWMSNVYYTNTIARMDDLKGMVFELSNMSQAQANMQGDVFSNEVDQATDIKSALSDMQNTQQNLQDSLREIDGYTWGTWTYMTNGSLHDDMQIQMESNVGQIKDDVYDIKDDTDKIKTKLGILY